MDPLLFGLNQDVVLEALGAIILLSLIIERGLSVVFGHKLFVSKLEGHGWKEPIALLVSWAVIYYIEFDVMCVFKQMEQA